MSVDYSPFADIFETKTHPHARTLRTSFSQKLTDAFNIIAGGILTETDHIGLFDYFTLFIPYLLIRANEWLDKSNYHTLSNALLVINAVIFIPRMLVAAIGTILCLPIIASVHGISQLIARQTYSEALEVVGENEDQEQISLSDHLIQTNLGIDDLNSTYQRLDNNNYELRLTRRDHFDDTPFLIKIAKEDGVVKQSANIHALFNLNIGRATSNLETMPSFNSDDKDFILSV